MCGVQPVEKFRQALREEGLSDMTVSHESNPTNDAFFVHKDIGGETFSITRTIDTHHNNELHGKQIANSARVVAEKYEKKMIDRFDSNGRSVEVMLHSTEPNAYCTRCNEHVYLDSGVPSFERGAELSTPRPIPKDQTGTVSELSKHSKVLVKLYLIGKLNEKCSCQNARLL